MTLLLNIANSETVVTSQQTEAWIINLLQLAPIDMSHVPHIANGTFFRDRCRRDFSVFKCVGEDFKETL